MNAAFRIIILEECKDGEYKSFHKSKIKWTLGKGLYYGVTNEGFPWVTFETTNFGSIQVGNSRTNVEPRCTLRNDAECQSCSLNSVTEMQLTANRMSREIIY